MEVKYVDHMGTDASVIWAAIVSNDKKAMDKYVDDDLRYTPAAERLIEFLARGCTSGEWEDIEQQTISHDMSRPDRRKLLRYIKSMPTHWTPFGHTAITVRVKAPIFVARQLGKHQVGFVWNEVSRRYVDSEPEFYKPEYWRAKAEDVKQGSSDEHVFTKVTDWQLSRYALDTYAQLLLDGVCPEQARMVLPQSMYTEWVWTGNLYAFAQMYNTRMHGSQKETQEVVKMIGDVVAPLFPISWRELTK